MTKLRIKKIMTYYRQLEIEHTDELFDILEALDETSNFIEVIKLLKHYYNLNENNDFIEDVLRIYLFSDDMSCFENDEQSCLNIIYAELLNNKES